MYSFVWTGQAWHKTGHFYDNAGINCLFILHVASCWRLLVDWTNPSLQYWHLYGLSPVCMRSCDCMLAFCTKPFPQKRHLCSLVSVWIFSCRFNEPIVGNSLLQNLHGNPLNSEWVLTCAGKFLLRTFLLHTSHSTSYNIARQNGMCIRDCHHWTK